MRRLGGSGIEAMHPQEVNSDKVSRENVTKKRTEETVF